jgi:hypothetical protein
MACREERSVKRVESPQTAGRPSPDSAEAGAKAEAGPSAGRYLAVTLPCGKDSAVKLYDDTTGEGDGYLRHHLIDSIPYEAGYFLERYYYEGYDWLFVSKEYCNQIDLYGPVHFNPSRTMFASVSNDYAAGFSANGVQMFARRDGFLNKELQDDIHAFGEFAFAWTDDSTFALRITPGNGTDTTVKNRMYELRDDDWQIISR